jgi:hypothetical protein
MMIAKRLIERLEEEGYAWRAYSGRGMYGRQCVAVPLENLSELFQLGKALGRGAPEPKTDSLGLGIIAYWPWFEVTTTTVNAKDGQ